MALDARTERCLKTVHPDLVKVYRRAVELQVARGGAKPIVTEGVRSVAHQREMVAKGASKTMNSRHLPGSDGLSRALDVCFIVNNRMNWSWPLYKGFADMMAKAGKELGIPVEWGGDWRTFKDGPHFQLPFRKYPK